MKKLTLLLLVGLLAAGCTVRQTGFTVLSTKHVELSRIDLKETDVARKKSGRDSRLWILFIPFAGNPTLENAVNDCLENGKGDFIINPIVDSSAGGRLFSLAMDHGMLKVMWVIHSLPLLGANRQCRQRPIKELPVT